MEDSATLGSDTSAITGLRGTVPIGIVFFASIMETMGCGEKLQLPQMIPMVSAPYGNKSDKSWGCRGQSPRIKTDEDRRLP